MFLRLSFVKLIFLVTLAFSIFQPAFAEVLEEDFSFNDVVSIEDMENLIIDQFPLGSARSDVVETFVEQGGAVAERHPTRGHVERYTYDIDLCGYYLWRWNISADYSDADKLTQVYVNGKRTHPDGTAPRSIPELPNDGKGHIFRAIEERQLAVRGENEIHFIAVDVDKDLATIEDQWISVATPGRADPLNLGKVVAYNAVERWRSVVHGSPSKSAPKFAGDCKKIVKQLGILRPD